MSGISSFAPPIIQPPIAKSPPIIGFSSSLLSGLVPASAPNPIISAGEAIRRESGGYADMFGAEPFDYSQLEGLLGLQKGVQNDAIGGIAGSNAMKAEHDPAAEAAANLV